jgi:hypothetical protein
MPRSRLRCPPLGKSYSIIEMSPPTNATGMMQRAAYTPRATYSQMVMGPLYTRNPYLGTPFHRDGTLPLQGG